MNIEQISTIINHLGIPTLLVLALTTIYRIGKFTSTIESLQKSSQSNTDAIKKNREDYDLHLNVCSSHWGEVNANMKRLLEKESKK